MKKIIFILSVLFIFVSCSNDDGPADQTTSCNCKKLYERRIMTTTSNTGWVSYGVNPESTNIKDCGKNGVIVGTSEFNGPTQIIQYRQILSCK